MVLERSRDLSLWSQLLTFLDNKPNLCLLQGEQAGLQQPKIGSFQGSVLLSVTQTCVGRIPLGPLCLTPMNLMGFGEG